jgi:hypothetical protein
VTSDAAGSQWLVWAAVPLLRGYSPFRVALEDSRDGHDLRSRLVDMDVEELGRMGMACLVQRVEEVLVLAPRHIAAASSD